MKNKGIHKGIFRGLVTLLLLFSLSVSAQSLTGTRGLIKAPTARMYESGTLAIGMGYIPPKFFYSTGGNHVIQGLRSGNAGLSTFITANILPFMEVMFRYTHEFNIKVTPQTGYFPDRMFSTRFKLLNEKNYIPAIVIGLQDISAVLDVTCDRCTNFTATYITGSKIFHLKDFSLDISMGYAADLLKLPAKDFKGFFGGIEIKHKEFNEAQLLIEYDTTSLNLGLQSYMFNRIHIVAGFMDFEPMFILAYRYKI